MRRTPLLTLGALAASLALAAPAFAATPALTGTDGPGFTIVLKSGSTKVKTLKPGKYALTIKDQSASHNFHLFGPGLNKVITTVPFVGTKKLTVTLKKGTYTYQCDPHASLGMKATFKVS
jgi:Copper binding proteins, plastocyanin/azurin family